MLVSFSSAVSCRIDDSAFTALLGAPVPHLALPLLRRVLLQLLSYPTEARITQYRVPRVRYTVNHYKAVLDGVFLSVFSPLVLL